MLTFFSDGYDHNCEGKTRRDFLNGVNVAVTGSLLSTPLSQALAALEVSTGDLSCR